MAITSSAKKAIRVAERRRVFNIHRKNELSRSLKALKRAIKTGKKADAEKLLPAFYKQLDKAAKTHVIKKGNASRNKSRFSKQIAKLK